MGNKRFEYEPNLTELASATLDGNKGMGILQIIRGPADTVVNVAGTWHVPNGEPLARTLSEADIGREVNYLGKLSDSGHPKQREIALIVQITSVGTYDFTPDLGEETEGEPHPLTIVNFKPVGELPYTS
jgi:hypothetical protein